MSFLSNLLFGRPEKKERISTQTGGQEDLLNFLIQQIMSGQGGFGFDEDFFNQSFVDPAMRQFEETTVPGLQQAAIASGQGRSSGLNDIIGRAGAQVQGDLSKQRAELLNQALNRQLQAANLALGTNAFNTEVTPQTGGLGSLAGMGIGSLFGPLGGSIGSAVGAGVSDMVRNRGFRR